MSGYHVAALCGTDVDQPRNMAKSVTVKMPVELDDVGIPAVLP